MLENTFTYKLPTPRRALTTLILAGTLIHALTGLVDGAAADDRPVLAAIVEHTTRPGCGGSAHSRIFLEAPRESRV